MAEEEAKRKRPVASGKAAGGGRVEEGMAEAHRPKKAKAAGEAASPEQDGTVAAVGTVHEDISEREVQFVRYNA